MAEEKKGKKKSGVFARILKWLGLGVLILLLIAGLFFQAPLKVNGLLLIFVVACTALPKKALKWFWLSVAAVVIALIIWVFLPDETQGWRPYTFDEEQAALEAKYAVPDSENVAMIYNQLLEEYDSNSFYFGLVESEVEKIPMREPWSSTEHPQIAEWLQNHQGIIDTLMQAAKKEKCRFPIPPYFDSSGRLSSMRRCAYLLITSANNDLGEGRINPALEKYFAVLQIGKHMYQQQTLIEMLVGVAIENLSLGQLNRLIVTEDLTEEHLWMVENALTKTGYDWNIKLPEVLEGEKLIAKNIWVICYEVNKDGRVRLTRNLMKAIAPQLPEDMQDKAMITYAKRKFTKAFMILLWFYMPSNPKEIGEVVDAAYEKYNEMSKPDYDWSKEPGKYSIDELFLFSLDWRRAIELSVPTFEEVFHKIHDGYLRMIAEKRGSLLIVALRLYKNETGRWPESLDEISDLVEVETLIDPINGDSFVYKLTPENFTLYSKGKNNIDKGGEHDTVFDPNSYEMKVNVDDWLFWPPRICKSEEEKEGTDEQKQ